MKAANNKKKEMRFQELTWAKEPRRSSEYRKDTFKIFSKSRSCRLEYTRIAAIKIAASLNLLKEKALKADLRVEERSPQKLIKKNDVRPISSHPKKKNNEVSRINKYDHASYECIYEGDESAHMGLVPKIGVDVEVYEEAYR